MAKILVMAKSGFGKALKNGTGVLTENGYVPIETSYEGMKIRGTNGRIYTVQGVYPQGELQVYKVYFSDGTVISCSEDHLWTIWFKLKGSQRLPATTTTASIYQLYLTDNKKRKPLEVMIPDAINNNQDVSFDPYTLGVLLGGGFVENGKLKIKNNCANILKQLKFPVKYNIEEDNSTSGDAYYKTFYISFEGNDPIIERLDNMDEPNIPLEYFDAGIEQRQDLLRGLVDTLGKKKGNVNTIYTCSKPFAADITAFARELGLFVKTYSSEENLDGKDKILYKIRFSNKKYKSIINIAKTNEMAEMTCIECDSPDHNYITENFTPTHNTTSWAGRRKLSIKGLDPKETFAIQCIGRSVPNENYKLCPSLKIEDLPKGNRVQVDSISGLDRFKKVAEILTALKTSPYTNIVIDDMNYLITDFYMANAMKSGWDVPKQLGYGMGLVFDAMKGFPEDKNIICFAHYEEYRSSNSDTISYKFKSIGKMIDEYITPEGKFDIILFGKTTYDTQNKHAIKQFVKGFDGEFPAKDSTGILDDMPDTFDNDMGIVVKKIKEYYNKN